MKSTSGKTTQINNEYTNASFELIGIQVKLDE